MKNKLFIFLVVSILLLSLQGLAFAETITYMTPETDPTSVKVDKTIIKRFEEANPGVNVKLSHADLEDLLPKLSMMLQAGTAPDVAFCSPDYVPPLVKQDNLANVEDLFKDIGDIPEKLVTPNAKNGIYDIPIAQEANLLYYRKDLFEEAGVEVPTTFGEWLEAAEALTKDTDGDGNIDQYGMTLRGKPPGNNGAFLSFLWANNGDLLDENGNVAIDSPEALEALKFWGELAEYCPPGVPNTSYHDMIANFATGKTAMVVGPGRLMANIDRYSPDLQPNVGIAAPPVGPSANEPAVWAPINNFVVFKGNNVDLAKKFTKFYLADKQYILFLTSAVPGHSLPTRKSWLDKKIYYENEDIQRWESVVKESLDLALKYSHTKMIEYDGSSYIGRFMTEPTFSRQLSQYLAEDVSAEDALDTIAETWEEMMK